MVKKNVQDRANGIIQLLSVLETGGGRVGGAGPRARLQTLREPRNAGRYLNSSLGTGIKSFLIYLSLKKSLVFLWFRRVEE